MTETTSAPPVAATANPPPATPPQENTVTIATPPEPARAAPPDFDAIRAEGERAAVERIAGYEPVLAGARGVLTEA